MALDYDADEIAVLESESCSWAGLIRIATPSPVRLWTGIGDFPVVNSPFDADGTVFEGGGRLINLPTFQRLANGIADRVLITLSGVTDDMRDLVYEEAEDVKGALFRLMLVVLDENWQQVGDVHGLSRGRVDVLETTNDPDGRKRIKTISLSVGSDMTGRAVKLAGTYTNADQQMRPGSEDDRACERTPLMSQSMVIKWPA